MPQTDIRVSTDGEGKIYTDLRFGGRAACASQIRRPARAQARKPRFVFVPCAGQVQWYYGDKETNCGKCNQHYKVLVLD